MAKNLKDVANQYAKAIFDLSSDYQIVDETLADLRAIKAVLADSPDFIQAATSNDVDAQVRVNLLQTLTQGAVEPVQNLVKLLARNQRLNVLPLVVDAFNQYYNEANGIVDVTAPTAVALDDARLSNVVDATILGGVILKSQSTLIDGSLQTKIAKMKAQLLG